MPRSTKNEMKSITPGGEGGIRTHDTVARMPHFECGAFNRSATSPSHCIIDGFCVLHSCKTADGRENGHQHIYFAPPDITSRNAASSLAAASLCIVSVTCEYRSIVVVMVEWPKRSCAIFG